MAGKNYGNRVGGVGGVRVVAALAAIAASFGGARAHADTLQARFTPTFSSSVTITHNAANRSVGAVRFNWDRVDAPGAGIDATVPDRFAAYCIELAQGVSANSNVSYEVLTPEAAGWSPERTLAVQLLWATGLDQVIDAASNAAFQIAIWELTHDTGRDLDAGVFRAASPTGAKSLAQSWLTGLDASLRGPLPQLTILRSPTAQDQVTVIPAPGAGACAAAGLVLLAARRRR